ncbi:PnuC protein [bacterium]|jgi:hypothetical protein|nr:PnuC protein [bacterium]
MLLETITQYYATDWVAMFTSFFWLYLVGNQKRSGFLFGIAASVAWFLFGMLTHSPASMIANIVFLVLNIRGYLKWGQDN